MLQDIRDRSTGWIAKVIVGVIVVLLSFTGFEAIMSSTSNRNNAAKVNGEEITLDALAQEKSLQQRQLAQQFGSDFDINLLDDKLLNEMALKSLIGRKLLLQAAADAGFVGSTAAVDSFILQFPEFQEDGQFSAQRFDQVLRQMGYGRMQFRRMLEQDILLGQLQSGIINSAFVTEAEALALVRLENQTRDFSMTRFVPDLNSIEVADDEVQAYYQANLPRFMSPEQVVIEYIELSKAGLAGRIEVDEDEVRAAYEAAVANLAEQRRAAHILFEATDEEQDAQALEQARATAKRIAAGEDFAELARELSADSGSSAEGGDLGFAGPDVFEPEFEEALYALEKGQVSEPVKTAYGWHLIKLLDVQAADIPAYAELRDSLLHDVRTAKAEQQFVELVDALESAAYEAADLVQPAQDLQLEVKTSPAFGREGGEGIFANRLVIETAFSEEVLEEGANSHALELDADTVVVLRVKQHDKPEQIALTEVSGEIVELLRVDKAGAQTRADGEQLLAALREGRAEPATDWQRFEAATRSQDSLDPQVLQQVFRMPKPEAGQPVHAGLALSDGSYVVVRLSGVSTPEDAVSADNLKALRDILASRQGQGDFAAFNRQLELDAKIEKF